MRRTHRHRAARTPSIVAALAAAATTLLGPALGLVGDPAAAHAQSIIKQPNEHPDYDVELEPHLNVGFFGPGLYRLSGIGKGRGNRGRFGEPAFGAGFRATPIIVDPGFIKKLNNTVGITFGIDLASCGDSCVNDVQIAIPLGMQWNFYVAEQWSVFGEVGGQFRTDFDEAWPDLLLQAGGRYHFDESLALTMRVGYPWFSVGLSIFAG
jgi:hypothetical protein